MSSKILIIRKDLMSKLLIFRNTLGKIELPQRFKGTIVEKWSRYWKQLGIDYKEAASNFIDEAKNKPLKSTIYSAIAISSYLCSVKNPSEKDFIERLRSFNNDLMLVHETCQNSQSAYHLKLIERCLNEGVLRRLTIGVISFIWIADYDKNVSVYKAQCSHLKPEYLKFSDRIIDIGFWGKWWKLEQKMLNYDIND